MFDQLKNLANLPAMMSRARELQSKMRDLQDELARREFTGEAGAGRAVATVNGRLELVRLRIDSARLDMTNVALVEDIITSAVRAAQAQAAEVIKSEMARLAGDLDLPPGLLPGA